MNSRTLSIAAWALVAAGLLIGASALASNQIPGKPQAGPILLHGADVYTVSGEVIQGGQVLVDEGRIVGVGSYVQAPAGVRRIDLTGKRIYPGLMATANDLGLVEIGAVRATRDQSETGQINPNVRAEVAVNPDSELIPVARANGVLLNLTVPAGGIISGSSALLQLDGWTWEEMTVRAPAAMHLNWPDMVPERSWWQQEAAENQIRRRDEQIQTITQAFADARAYLAAKKAAEASGRKMDFDARWEAMIPLLEGRIPLVVAADEVQQIQAAVSFAEREKVKLVILGGYDAPLCAELLRRHDVAVIVHGVHRLPRRRHAPYDEAFTLPERLRQAGIRFCITGNERSSNARNLPYHAATAVAHGLPMEEALRAITLYPAQIFGAADRVGSIEVGKDATLIVADGDVLETATKIEMALVQGREVDLSSRHTRLWEKYREKYRRLGGNEQ